MKWIDCRWCELTHDANLLCPPARKILGALAAKGAEGNMPDLDFPDDPIDAKLFGLGDDPGDTLIGQLVVQAAVTPVADVPRATLIYTGQDADGRPLPKWVHIGTDEDIANAARLVASRADLAIRTAAGQRRPAGQG